MPAPAQPGRTACPNCGKPMTPHCQRTMPKNGGKRAQPCGWLQCLPCLTVMRIKDRRVLPKPSETSK